MAKEANKSQNKGKKRRFLQQAHPLPPPSTSTSQQPVAVDPPRSSDSRGSDSGDLGSLTGGKSKSTVVASSKNTQSAVVKNNSKPKRRGPPLQTSKSIEDLESILERRYGTAATTTGKKEGDADFVLSFGGDDDDYENDGASKSKGKRRDAKVKGAPVFKANRVLDPWAKEEGIYEPRQGETSKEDIVEEKPKQQKKQKYDRNEAMLNRVRSNQERLQSKRGDGSKKKKGGAKGGDGYDVVPVDVSRDYYDEDDEGYEDRGRKEGNSLISPRPVGGKGSFSKSSSSSSSASSLSGGIFSDQSTSNTNAHAPKKKERWAREKKNEETKPKKPKQPRSKPLLDEDGKEMFMTLEQADKTIQTILSGDEGMDGIQSDVSSWEDIGITDSTLLSNLQSSEMACPNPLPVQDQACPPLVAMNDVLISTHTGSGKTLAFLAPIAQSLMMMNNDSSAAGGNNNNNAFPRAIVVAPGRELASQIVSVAQSLFKDTGLTVSLAIGGTPYGRNVEKLRKKKPDLVVGTPGRIAELIIGRPGDKSGKMKISNLQTAVLDEFDALLQYKSHKEPTMAIMDALDRQHGRGNLQKVLCSATASDMMQQKDGGDRGGSMNTNNIIEEYLRPGYAHASVDDNDLLVTTGVQTKTKGGALTTSARVSRTTIHGALHVPHKRLALEAVRKILNTNPVPQQVLIFVDSPRRVDIVIEKLAKMDIIAAPLHGGATTKKTDRAQVNKALREGYVGIVVATEMAARGIDAPYLTHVINLDLPTDSSHYAHRAGRCGRGGRPGVAVSITCDVKEKGVPRKFAQELGIEMFNVEAFDSKLRIVES